MPHPAGIVTYVPQGKFWFPRSYVTKLKIHTNHVNVPTYTDGIITWTHSPPDSVIGFTKIKDVFIPWTSNTYSLDFLVEYWYYQILPSPTEFEWGGELSFAYDSVVQANCLIVATESADTDYYYDLEPPPLPYWPENPTASYP